jgi:hypothetical protein
LVLALLALVYRVLILFLTLLLQLAAGLVEEVYKMVAMAVLAAAHAVKHLGLV